MDYTFKTETIHDLSVHKEFSKGFLYASKSRSFFYLLTIPLFLYYIFNFRSPVLVRTYLIVSALFLLAAWLRNPKKGDINYRRMLVSNNGNPVHSIIEIGEEGIQSTEHETGNRKVFSYDQFRSLIETERLLILTMQYRLCLVLQKSWLQGGTPRELSDYLLSHCPNIKRKRVRTTTFGQWVYWIHMAVLIIGTLLALTNLPHISLWDRISGVLHNEMTYQEMAAELSKLDIVISEQTIEELDAYDADYANDYGEDYYSSDYSESKIIDLLYWEGSGVYDEETWEWTPSTSGVYWLDLEVWSVDSIYTDFFTGLSAMNSELDFSNVAENYQDVNWDSGTGTIYVSFDYQGNSYELEAAYYYDWFDTDVLLEVCRILSDDSNPNDLYFAYDGQAVLLYYGNASQVHKLGKKTGLTFSKSEFFIFN